jgi:NADP-dependent 3-hydroxy acid dehydrogenase YdfG
MICAFLLVSARLAIPQNGSLLLTGCRMNKSLVVITGASSGIGKALAYRFSQEGHSLLLIARRNDLLQSFNLPRTITFGVDVRDVNSFKQAIQQAVDAYGPVDCLINNAGIMLLSEAEQQIPEQIKQMLDINLLGVFNGIHCVLSDMKNRQSGTIINMSSIAGRKSFPFHAGYNATKFGVHALSESIRQEVAKSNVRVCTIAPGIVDTELLSHTTSESIKTAFKEWQASLQSILTPDDVARSVYFVYSQPQNVTLRELVITATSQET